MEKSRVQKAGPQKLKSLGEFEITVMAAVLRLGDGAYGVAVLDEIADRTGRQVSIGALYATLSRLETKKLVQSRLGEATAERGGRAKKFYTLTKDGHAAFEHSAYALGRMLVGLPGWSKGISTT